MSKKPWKTELVLLFLGAQFICFSLATLTANVLQKFHVNGFKREDDFGIILLATLGFQGATWILIPIFLRLNKTTLREAFGLQAKDLFRSLGLAMATLIVVLPVALLLENLSGTVMEKMGIELKQEAAVELLNGAPLWPTGIYLAVFAVVLAPVAEEFIFRGVLFPFVKNLGHPKTAWFGVSILFALIHGDIMVFVPLFVLALALTWLYEKTDNLLAPIVTHSLFNTVNLVALCVLDHSLPSPK